MVLWDDNPSLSDLLGFQAIAEPVCDALTREHLDPVCVGVFGRWGCGKTTILQLIQRVLSDSGDDVIAVYTQPWAYDPATDPKATLIAEVLTELRRRLELKASLSEALRARFIKLATRVRIARVVKLTAKTALTAQLPSIVDD